MLKQTDKGPSTGRQTVYYVNSSNEIAFYYSHSSLGWVKGVVGGSVKPGTSPTSFLESPNNYQYIYCLNPTGAMSNWTWAGKWIGPNNL